MSILIYLCLTAAVAALFCGLLAAERQSRLAVCLTIALSAIAVRISFAAAGAAMVDSNHLLQALLEATALVAIAAAAVVALGTYVPLAGARRAADAADLFDTEHVAIAVQVAEQKLQIEQMSHDLAFAKQAKNDFLTNLGHEIRQPLTAILGFADMLVEAHDAKEAEEIAQTIQRNGKQLMELLSDVLDLAHLESGKLRIGKAPCGPKEIVEDLTATMRPRAEAKGLQLKLEFAASLPEVIHTDATRLRQTLVSLVSNAMRFTEKGSITIATRLLNASSERPELEIRVIDTGIGMSEELVGRLFNPFSKGSGKAEKYNGTGLGLTICRRLVELMDGTIEAASRLNEGSCFTVRIPTGELEGVRMIDPNKQHFPADPARSAGEALPCKVLVVEDSRDNQRLISFVLKKAGAKVELADDGAQGIAAVMKAELEAAPYDLILMDMQMPVLDGFDATAHLRSVGFRRPIVALTALALDGDRQRCLDAGCDDYITKPIDREVLLRVVSGITQESLNRAEREPAAVAAN